MLIASASIVLIGLSLGAFFGAPMLLMLTLLLVVWSVVDGLLADRLMTEVVVRTLLGVTLLQSSYFVGLFLFGWLARLPDATRLSPSEQCKLTTCAHRHEK